MDDDINSLDSDLSVTLDCFVLFLCFLERDVSALFSDCDERVGRSKLVVMPVVVVGGDVGMLPL